jgi:adenosylmethionine-8-amino-7-oxononanoate aminotransferase
MCADELESIVVKEGPETVAAFIVEPVVGTTTGGTHPPRSYFERISEFCDRYGILLVVDEVMSGFGRTGARFAVDHWGCKPDLIAAGKGLGSGYAPLFVTIVNARITAAIAEGSGRVSLGNTYNANPLSCAVGSAVLHKIRQLGLVEAAEIRGKQLRGWLEKLYSVPIVGDVRGIGLMQGVELVADQQTRAAFAPELRVSHRVAEAARGRGLLVTDRGATRDGRRGDNVFLTPPLTVSEAEVDTMGKILVEAVAEVADQVEGVAQ